MESQQLLDFRTEQDRFFKESPNSPLSRGQQAKFEGLEYFDHAPELDIIVEVQVFAKQENVQIQTTTGELRWYLRYGEFRFDVGGEEARLTIFKMPPDYFFLPFVDSLAPKETYPAGRYLEPEPLGGDQYRINFNLAYNPYCAYSPAYSCPITPAENRLRVPIRAGEKNPIGAWVLKE